MENKVLLSFERNIESLKENQVRAIATHQVEDRYGTIVDVEGLDIDGYRNNPVVFYNHNSKELPIARSTVEKVGEMMICDIYFDEEDPLAMEICRKVKKGFINAVSLGFLPDPRFAEEEEGVLIFRKADLLEISVVNIPGNKDAIIFDRKADEEKMKHDKEKDNKEEKKKEYSLQDVECKATRYFLSRLMEKEKEEKEAPTPEEVNVEEKNISQEDVSCDKIENRGQDSIIEQLLYELEQRDFQESASTINLDDYDFDFDF